VVLDTATTPAAAPTEPEEVRFELLSPASVKIPAQVYIWPFEVERNGTDPAFQLVTTITLLSKEELLKDFFGDEFEEAARQFVKTDLATVRRFVGMYNQAIRAFWKSREEAGPDTGPMWRTMSTELLQHIMAMVYSKAVTDPTKLNQYKGWSEEVYGEFTSSMISEIVEKVPIRPGDRFIDLGSGVGQVVLQVAAEAMCSDSFGVEKQKNPALYAKVMEEQFKSTMEWFGKMYGKYEILHGDFLDEQFRSRILDANIIFVNNFAFGTAVNQKLKEIFQYCHEGCRIVSSLNFAPMGFTITERTMGDIGCILSVRRVTCSGEGVSWTARPFDYYVHTIDHTMMHEFFSNPDRRPVRCSAPEPEPEPAPPSPPPEPRAPKPRAKPKEKASEAAAKRRASISSAAAEKAKARAAKAAAAAAKRSASSPTQEQKRKPLGGPLTRISDERRTALASLDRKLKADMGPMISELELKASAAEDEVADLQAECAKLATDTAELRMSVERQLSQQIDDARGRLPGRSQLKGPVAAKQVQLAVDTVAENQLWRRAHGKLGKEVQALRGSAEHLTMLSDELAPEARCLSTVLKVLNIHEEWDWASTLSPTLEGLAHAKGILRKRVPPAPRGGSLPGITATSAGGDGGPVANRAVPSDPLKRWVQVYFAETVRETPGAVSFETVRAIHKSLPQHPNGPQPAVHHGANGSAGGHSEPPPPPGVATLGGRAAPPPPPPVNGYGRGPPPVSVHSGPSRGRGNGYAHHRTWDRKAPRPLDHAYSNGRSPKRQMTGPATYNDRYGPTAP